MRILLDTCTFLWIVTDAPELTSKARSLFLDSENEVFLSPVSAWEIAVKWKLGKLPLPEAPDRFVTRLRRTHGIATLSLHERAAVHLAKLPDVHRDPFDRMLICQAITGGLSVMTPDAAFRDYPVPTLW